MVRLDSSSPVGVSIYKRTSTFLSPVLVNLADANFESGEWAGRFKYRGTKKHFLREISTNGVFIAHLR